MENFEDNIHNLSLCFRNRLNILMKNIIEKKNLDAILLILCKNKNLFFLFFKIYKQKFKKIKN